MDTKRQTHLRVGVVAAPIWANGRLAAQVPYLKVDVLIRDGLDVEADRCVSARRQGIRYRRIGRKVT